MPEFTAAEVLTTEVPALALNGEDLIVADPDRPKVDVRWQLTSRKEVGTTDALRVVVEYLTADGKEGCHEFEDPAQMVTVRVPRYQATTHGLGVAA